MTHLIHRTLQGVCFLLALPCALLLLTGCVLVDVGELVLEVATPAFIALMRTAGL